MPCDPIKMQKMDALLDSFLELREKYPDDDEEDITDPLDAPPQMPLSDSPPEKIHGEGVEDQELWPPKPHVPVPIEHL
jgi:hypothetical protein